MQRILVVDDDYVQVDVVSFLLRRAGFEPVPAFDVESSRDLFEHQAPALVILDVQLGQADGRDLLRQFKQQRPEIPILMLTVLGAEDDRVHGLELGADDYLAKPFGYRELIARVRALLRRRTRKAREQQPQRRLQVGSVILNPMTHEVVRDGRPVDLSPTEFRLLHTLMEHPNEMVSTRTLLQEVWGHQDITARNVVRVTAGRVRAKLEVDPGHPRLLQTVSGEGLIFRAERDAAGPPGEGPVALEVVAELRELMGQMGTQPLQQLNQVFVQASTNYLDGMRAALARGDSVEVAREAHRLRGAGDSVGAQRVAYVCGLVEDRARVGDLARVDALLGQIEQERSAFEQAIVPMLSTAAP